MEEGDRCPYCCEAFLEEVEDWIDGIHLQCPRCDSTYNIEEED